MNFEIVSFQNLYEVPQLVILPLADTPFSSLGKLGIRGLMKINIHVKHFYDIFKHFSMFQKGACNSEDMYSIIFEQILVKKTCMSQIT